MRGFIVFSWWKSMKSCGSDCILARALYGRIVADIIPGPFRYSEKKSTSMVEPQPQTTKLLLVTILIFVTLNYYFFPMFCQKSKIYSWQNLLMVKSHLFRACRGSSNELAMATPPRHSRGRAAAAVEPVSNETMRRQGREPPGGFRSKKTRPGRQKCPELWMGFCWNSDLRFWLCVFVGEKLLAQELKRLGIFWVASSWGGLKRTCLPRISHVCYSNPLCFLVQPLFFGRKSLWCVFSQWNSCFLLAKI